MTSALSNKLCLVRSVREASGFTLIEMVATIVVMGILSIAITNILAISMKSYVATTYRTEMVDDGRFLIQRISREVRSALPGSVRIKSSGDNQCVEFVPIVAGATYVKSYLPDGSAVSSFDVVDFDYISNGNHFVAIGTSYVVAGSVYNATKNYRVGLSSVAAVDGDNFRQVTLDSSHLFAEGSPTRRVYIANTPVSFCLIGNTLKRYHGYSFSTTQSSPPSGGVLIGKNIKAASTPFNFSAGSLVRNALLQIDLELVRVDESVRFSHEVNFRNVM